jgi:predicted SAM-dependent methyltransferase
MPRLKLHQVVATWSPWAMLPQKGKGFLRKAWKRIGLGRDCGTFLRYELDMLLLRNWCKVSLKHRRHIKAFKSRRGMKIHLGCGNTLKAGWVNVDCYPPPIEPGCEVFVTDMRSGLPFPDRSVQTIYSEHLFEHFPINTTREMLLPECFRILSPGGTIRVGVPDGELWIDAYVAHRSTGEKSRFVAQEATSMMAVNAIARSYGHWFLWDYETLRHTFEQAGFARLRKARAGDTQFSEFESHDQTDPWRVAQTVYVEGVRP